MSEVYNQVFSSVWPSIRTQIIKYVEEQIFLQTAHINIQDVLDFQSTHAAHVGLMKVVDQIHDQVNGQLNN
jgi:hypothetical protein